MKQRRIQPKRLRGVTLIELMVSLVIGSLLIAGAVTVYMQSRNTYRTNETAARLQEIARYALDVIEPDVRLASYWGLLGGPAIVEHSAAPGEAQDTIDALVANNCGNNWAVNLSNPIEGRDSADTGGSGYDLDCGATNPVDWADVLIIRRATSETSVPTNGRIQIQTNRFSGTLFADGTIPSEYDSPASETHNLLVHAYYISEVLPSPNGIRQFALRRQTLVGGAGPSIQDQEVIPGVEDLQVQFGVDTNTDGNADVYSDPEGIVAGDQVVSARIWLRVIGEDREMGFINDTDYGYANADYGPFNDDRRRILISKTIQLRNGRVCTDSYGQPILCP